MEIGTKETALMENIKKRGISDVGLKIQDRD